MIKHPLLIGAALSFSLAVGAASLYSDSPPENAPPANPAIEHQEGIPRLITGLESGGRRQRKQASRLLAQQGTPALAPLSAALAGPTTPSERKRLRSMIAIIMKASALRGPLISVHFTNVPLNVAFANICGKIGIQASPYPGYTGGKPTVVTLQEKKRPFWAVMRQLAASTGYSPSYGTLMAPDGGSLMYARPGLLSNANLVSRYHGFMVVAQSIGRSSSEQLGGINAGTFFRSLDVGLAILPPPYRSYRISFAQPQAVRATDSLHQSLLPDRRPVSSYFNDGSPGTMVYNLTIELRYPPHLGARIVQLKGYIPALLQSRAIKCTFTNLGKIRQSKLIDGFRVSIDRLKRSGVGWSTSVQATPLHAAAELSRSSYTNIARQIGKPDYITAIGVHGGIIPQMNFATEQEDYRKRKYMVTFFRKPKTIILRVFRTELSLKIPFEFKDIPIP